MDISKIDRSKLIVKVLSLQKTVFEGDAVSVSSYNVKGPFDVLPLHTQLITVCQKEVIVRGVDGSEMRFALAQGVMRVAENTVKVFLGFESLGNLGGVKV